MIGVNTMLGMELFKDEFESSIVLHIPHAKTEIPEKYKSDFVSQEIVDNEISLLTDFATDEIFEMDGVSKVVFPYSRIFCDVERLDDDNEVMFKYGRGFFYTKTDSGELLRENLNGNKEAIHTEYYTKHHDEFNALVNKKLQDNGVAVIIDCHSFSNTPFKSDIEQGTNRPDFCLGVDDFHTPKWLVDMIYGHLKQNGYSVEINYPYVGTIVPLNHYQINDSVLSVMIEVNRDLYMDGDKVNDARVDVLNKLLTDIFITE